MLLTLDWHIPWDVPTGKRIKAAEKLKTYIVDGGFFESSMRMRVVACEIMERHGTTDDPWLKITLER